jgi:hypothetical protein
MKPILPALYSPADWESISLSVTLYSILNKQARDFERFSKITHKKQPNEHITG